MLSNTVLSLAALTALASAAPAAMEPVNVVYEAPSFGDAFGIGASGGAVSALHNQVSASQGRVYIGGKQDQPTNCSSAQTVHDFATFAWYSDKQLYLYTNSNPVQQVWSDAGYDGLVGYSTDKESKPPGESLAKFEIDATSRLVTFNGVGPKACPGGETADQYGIWFSDSDRPGNLDGCFAVELKAYKTPARDSCTYSHLPSCEEALEGCGSMKDPIGM
ncbi:hypothetical protein CLAFUW4_02476 [Fulvia fulva]|uniref:Phialide A n=1 Tax=Passalora fulva TaxID=5499 RepID=A0A1P8YXM3_PASFU|nr:uncharacterized protein CLAFUR5_02466 [Fulvia fulva]AQA29256.1 phialide A [Fulvia fulva]KAK4632124.1 hypothetical protein CLAFUR4_02471 [Fulvia fulva]KAK4633298.1 hypothetical protein CLAFUR0_02475 [Fulvia fulva]UJO14439.1 hypothetical protein CLAFUR5_02466 [Fulvia fulva]WPV10894.1 hypothetical protein CLAFUW4_02476 [Fulvia fulva]